MIDTSSKLHVEGVENQSGNKTRGTMQDLVKVIFTANAGSFLHEKASELPLTYGINHAGLPCEGFLCRGVVEHVEGDNTIPCRPDIQDVSQLGGLLNREERKWYIYSDEVLSCD